MPKRKSDFLPPLLFEDKSSRWSEPLKKGKQEATGYSLPLT